MKHSFLKANAAACLMAAALFASCDKDKKDDPQNDDGALHKIAVQTTINTQATAVAYLGTFADFSVGSYTNAKARQIEDDATDHQIYGGDLYIADGRGGDKLTKYSRRADGTLEETGRLTIPAASWPYSTAFQSADKGYLTLNATGKVLVFNPKTMEKTGEIDLTEYAIGDASPDPSAILYRDGKLYVACLQSSDVMTSAHPAQILIVDLADNNKITSLTDARSAVASDMHTWRSMFFDEKGDLYVLCMASWGAIPGQKAGLLRVKKGETEFDKDYFLNVSDYSVPDIQGNKILHLNRISYAGNGILYATGNVAGLMSNPPDYINDYSFGAFKIDLASKTITKLGLPYSIGYAISVLHHEGKVYFGLSTKSGVGIFSYDPATNTASDRPIVSTEGNPRALQAFE